MGNILQFFRRILGGTLFLLLLLYVGSSVPNTYDFIPLFLSKNQLVPALLAGSFFSVTVILLFTLCFGRWYCSCLCPLGILQDGLGRLLKSNRKYKDRSSSRTKLRYFILTLCLMTYFLSTTMVLLLVEPWSVFGRLSTTFILPVITFANNFLADIFHSSGNYTFIAKGYHSTGISVFITAVFSLFLLVSLTLRFHSRFWCNTICPVGSVLNFLAKKSPLRIRIDQEKCTSCGLCELKCKVRVINVERGLIDSGNCIACFNCLPVCRHKAISYTLFTKETTK